MNRPPLEKRQRADGMIFVWRGSQPVGMNRGRGWMVWRPGAQDNARHRSQRLHVAGGAWLRATPREAAEFEALPLLQERQESKGDIQ